MLLLNPHLNLFVRPWTSVDSSEFTSGPAEPWLRALACVLVWIASGSIVRRDASWSECLTPVATLDAVPNFNSRLGVPIAADMPSMMTSKVRS